MTRLMPIPDPSPAGKGGNGRGLWERTAAAQPQESIPNGDEQQDRENTEHEERRYPALRLGFAADPDHDASDLIGTACFRAPKAIAVGLEHEFAVAVGAPGQHRRLCLAGCEYLHLGIRHRLPVGRRKLRRYLMRREEVER